MRERKKEGRGEGRADQAVVNTEGYVTGVALPGKAGFDPHITQS